MALRYRIYRHDSRGGSRRPTALSPDYCEYEAARENKENLNAGGDAMYSVAEINIPTGTTQAQDMLVQWVRDVRYHERRIAITGRNTVPAQLEIQQRRLTQHLERIREKIAPSGELDEVRRTLRSKEWEPRHGKFMEFYLDVEEWQEWKIATDRMQHTLQQCRDRLVHEHDMPFDEKDIGEAQEIVARLEDRIDSFVHQYDTMPPVKGASCEVRPNIRNIVKQ